MRLLGENYNYRSWLFSLSYIVLIVVLSHAIALSLPGKWLLPALLGGGFFILFMQPVNRGEYGRAVVMALVWAAIVCVGQIILTVIAPGLMETHILKGVPYREEMLEWVRTGRGPEGDIRLFLPIHIRHFAVFIVLNAASAGALGLMMGAAMLGYMNFYVGSLIAASSSPLVPAVFGWPVWSVVRVAGYIMAGTALGAVLLHRRGQAAGKWAGIRRYMLWALALMALDVLLKWSLAGAYQRVLSGALGGG